MDAHQRGGLIADCPRVVLDPCSIRRADLDEPGARGGEDLRNPKGPADLDELSTGDHDFLISADRGDREHHRGRVVVDRKRALGAGQLADQLLHVHLPAPTLAAFEIELEIRVATGDPLDRLERAVSERCPAEVGVHDDTGGVYHGVQARELEPLQRRCGSRRNICSIRHAVSTADARAAALDLPTRRCNDEWPRRLCRQRAQRLGLKQFLDGRERAEAPLKLRVGHAPGVRSPACPRPSELPRRRPPSSRSAPPLSRGR